MLRAPTIFIDGVERAHTIASILAIDKDDDEARANIDSMAFCLPCREASRVGHFLGSFFVP